MEKTNDDSQNAIEQQRTKVNNLLNLISVKIVYSNRFNGEPVGEIEYDPNTHVLTGFYAHAVFREEKARLIEMEQGNETNVI
jgi:hypothetical protein